MKKTKKRRSRVGRATEWNFPPLDDILLFLSDREHYEFFSKDFPQTLYINRPDAMGIRELATRKRIEIPDSILRYLNVLNASFYKLQNSAIQGNSEAALALFFAATVSTRCLTQIANQNPDAIRSFSEEVGVWPILSGKHTDIRKENVKIFNKLDLRGTLRSIDYESIGVDGQQDPPSMIAEKIYLQIETIRKYTDLITAAADDWKNGEHEACRKKFEPILNSIPWLYPDRFVLSIPLLQMISGLPDLSNDLEITELWWQAVREILMLNTLGNPETDEDLRKLGLSRANHKSSGAKPASREANIRSKALVAIRGHFFTIARRRGNRA